MIGRQSSAADWLSRVLEHNLNRVALKSFSYIHSCRWQIRASGFRLAISAPAERCEAGTSSTHRAYTYFEGEPGRRSAAKLLTRGAAHRRQHRQAAGTAAQLQMWIVVEFRARLFRLLHARAVAADVRGCRSYRLRFFESCNTARLGGYHRRRCPFPTTQLLRAVNFGRRLRP